MVLTRKAPRHHFPAWLHAPSEWADRRRKETGRGIHARRPGRRGRAQPSANASLAACTRRNQQRQNLRILVTQRMHSRPLTLNASGANIPDPRSITGQETQRRAPVEDRRESRPRFWRAGNCAHQFPGDQLLKRRALSSAESVPTRPAVGQAPGRSRDHRFQNLLAAAASGEPGGRATQLDLVAGD